MYLSTVLKYKVIKYRSSMTVLIFVVYIVHVHEIYIEKFNVWLKIEKPDSLNSLAFARLDVWELHMLFLSPDTSHITCIRLTNDATKNLYF